MLSNYALNLEVEDLETRIRTHISVALQYACRSWHSHLVKPRGAVVDVISGLHTFLKEKYLAWLEVVSVLGAIRAGISALEHLVSWLQEVPVYTQWHYLILTCAIN